MILRAADWMWKIASYEVSVILFMSGAITSEILNRVVLFERPQLY